MEGREPGSDLSYEYVQQLEDIQTIENKIPISTYLEEYRKRSLKDEFEVIKLLTESQRHKELLRPPDRAYKQYNRYNEIVPYLHSEVRIEQEEGETELEAYINASYITDYQGLEQFICTQGPLPNTRRNFWRMVWMNNVSLILMISRVTENGRKKCDQYWPEVEGESYELNGYRITNKGTSEPTNKHLTATQIEINYNTETKYLIHTQCISWPDHSIPHPKDLQFLVQIIDSFKSSILKNPESKILIHCSAGIGRTGTMLAIFNVISAIEYAHQNGEEGKVGIFEAVRRMREKRFGMVQTIEQYKFIYDFIGYWLKNNYPDIITLPTY